MPSNAAAQQRVATIQPNLSFSAMRDASGLLALNARSAGTYDSAAALLAAFDNPAVGGSFPTTLRSGHIDVRSRHVIYIHSEALAGMKTIGPNGSRTVISRIPVLTTYGGMVTKEHSSHPLDYVPVGGRTLTTIDIQIRDSFGDLIPLHGGHVSLELLFCPEHAY